MTTPTAEYFYTQSGPMSTDFERGLDMRDLQIDPDAMMMMPELGGFDWVTIWKNPKNGDIEGIKAVGAPGDPIEVEH